MGGRGEPQPPPLPPPLPPPDDHPPPPLGGRLPPPEDEGRLSRVGALRARASAGRRFAATTALRGHRAWLVIGKIEMIACCNAGNDRCGQHGVAV
ncbi:MAG: hypothetical protein IPM07_25880 [Anaerolineales bacterium]|nr:hypothetical protein [Anaerolineales bacterium]